MSKSHKVILHYKGKYGYRKVPKNWYNLRLPGPTLSLYIDEAENSPAEDIEFVYSGKSAHKDGIDYPLWEAKETSNV